MKDFTTIPIQDRTSRQIAAIDKLEQHNWIGTITAYTGLTKFV